MGRPRKPYFGEAQSSGERSGLLSSSASQDAIGEAASDPPSPGGRYQGMGRTPHSLSAPAGLGHGQEVASDASKDDDDAADDDDYGDGGGDGGAKEPAQADLIVIT